MQGRNTLQTVEVGGNGINKPHYPYAKHYQVGIHFASDYTLAAHMGIFGHVAGLTHEPVKAAEEWNRRYIRMPYAAKAWARRAHEWANNS